MKVFAEEFSYVKIQPNNADIDNYISRRLDEQAFPRENYSPSQYIADTSIELDIECKLQELIRPIRKAYRNKVLIHEIQHWTHDSSTEASQNIGMLQRLILVLNELQSWNVDQHFPQYIVTFKLKQEEKESDQIHILQINKNDTYKYLKIQDFSPAKEFMMISSSKTHCLQATENTITAIEMFSDIDGCQDVMTLVLGDNSFSDLEGSQVNDLHGFRRIISLFYDQTDHFNAIIECIDNSIIIEKIFFKSQKISIKGTLFEREFDFSEDSVQQICFDYEFMTIISLKESGGVEIFKNSVLLYTKNDGNLINLNFQVEFDDIWIFNKTMYFFSKGKNIVSQIKFVSQDQISDLVTEKKDSKEWQSIKQKGYNDLHFIMKEDQVILAKLNYIRIIDINQNKVIEEIFIDSEVKKIVQVVGHIYLIKDKPGQILSMLRPNNTIFDFTNIEGTFKQVVTNTQGLYLITQTDLEDDVLVNFTSRKTTHDKIILFNLKEQLLTTLYFQKDEIRKFIVNNMGKKADMFKTDEWFAFENRNKTKIYFQKYDNHIGQMRTFEIDKYNSNIRILSTLPWLNSPVICGDLIYEINYVGAFTYRIVDHYISGYSMKIDIADQVFSTKIVSVGNRVAIQERVHRIRIYNQPSQNSILPSIFEQQKYKIYGYLKVKNTVTILDNKHQLITINTNNGKVINGFKISHRLISENATLAEQI